MKRIAAATVLAFALATPMWGDVQPSAPPEASAGYMLASYFGMSEQERNLASAAGAVAGAAAAWRGARVGAVIGGTIGGFAGVVVGATVGAA